MDFRSATAGGLLLAVFIVVGSSAPSSAQVRQPDRSKIERAPGTQVEKIEKIDVERVGELVQPQAKLPTTLLIGNFTLRVEQYSNSGKADRAAKQVTGASGTAWVSFSCPSGLTLSPVLTDVLAAALAEGLFRRKTSFEVVPKVTKPEAQLSVEEARLIRRDAAVGQRVEIDLPVSKDDTREIVRAKNDLIGRLKPVGAKGDIRVHFDDVTIVPVEGQPDSGRITAGSAAYPTDPAQPKVIRLAVDGFTVVIDNLNLTPTMTRGNITLQLPACMGSAATCGPATVPLGMLSISPNCEFYVERPDDEFGPWIVGDTGMVAEGKGFIADFSSTQSPGGRPAAWKGLALASGTATGEKTVPDHSNTGYLAAGCTFPNGSVSSAGFTALLSFSGPHEFTAVDPEGYVLKAEAGKLNVVGCKIASGKLGPGVVVLPSRAACGEVHPGTAIKAEFATLTIQDDLDVAGEVAFQSGVRLSWGELTHVGDEAPAWEVGVKAGYIYLPAKPRPTFSPDTGAAFLSFNLSTVPADALAEMEAKGMSGIGIAGSNMENIAIHSPDRPGGTANPVKLKNVSGWLRVGHVGVDADIKAYEWNKKEPLGDETRTGYVGRRPFDATLNPSQKERHAVFRFAASACYDSHIDGSVDLANACNIKGLQFANMKTSSTANLVGGDISLPTGGVTLDYWGLPLVPTGDPAQAGVISVRTGRLVFTAAGISEPVHFDRPFDLTWGEILADGNLGQLFFDYNSYGQRFDKLKFSPHNIALSQYVAGRTDGYVAVCGAVYVNFFGSAYCNIQDARNDAQPGDPYKSRRVTVPATGEAACKPTDLRLHGEWDDVTGKDLSTLDFPSAQMAYNEKLQQGFTGTGTAGVSFIRSDPLEATIEIRGDAIDICMTSTAAHDLDVGLFLRLGGISNINGCVRIVGPTMERMVIGGYLEQAAGTGMGLLAPKAGSVVEVVSCVTPNYCTFYSSGDMLLAVAGSAVDLSGTVFLKRDWSKGSTEGDVTARINCNSVMGGLEGNGQLTWFADAVMQYLQGRLGVSMCGWTGGAGLEGGMFIGHNVPKAKAWVLQTTTGRFGVTQQQLPDTLTGLYGYGQVSFGVNWYVFGGGVELYAGLGAFVDKPGTASSSGGTVQCPGLPYVIGCAGCYVHGEILGGLVSAAGWANLILQGPIPYFEGTFGLEGCVLWVLCASIDVTAGLNSDGFYML